MLAIESLQCFAGKTCSETFCKTFAGLPKKFKSPKPTTETNFPSTELEKLYFKSD